VTGKNLSSPQSGEEKGVETSDCSAIEGPSKELDDNKGRTKLQSIYQWKKYMARQDETSFL